MICLFFEPEYAYKRYAYFKGRNFRGQKLSRAETFAKPKGREILRI